MIPRIQTQTRISFCFPHVCDPGDLRSGVSLLVLLLVLQRIIVPLVVGAPTGLAVFNTKCNVNYLAQVLFPWTGRVWQRALGRYTGRCLLGQASVLVPNRFKFYCWFKLLQPLYVEKNFFHWYLFNAICAMRRTGALHVVMLCGLRWVAFYYPVPAALGPLDNVACPPKCGMGRGGRTRARDAANTDRHLTVQCLS